MIVADTHAWVWWIDWRHRLSKKARAALDGADEIGVSVISCREVALLNMHGRLTLDRDVMVWITQALEVPQIRLLDLTPQIAVASTRLDWRNDDPADRLIVATAMAYRARIVSKDRRIRSLPLANAIW
ncbi:MAG TPA: type II toxin-antitoxin system VapC family toxin [Thermoanaerobaculia bacterium]|nr:type II toxin-antitoxin system VapC family toxin [Thermoanaerobaculia bacterium]